MMVGSEFRTAERRAEGAGCGDPRLEVWGLSMESGTLHGVGIADIGFSVTGGEILGIAGVAGNGQGELLAALAGERPGADADSVRINGSPAGRFGPARRRALGLGVVPEERNGHAAVPELSLAENVLLTGRTRLGLVARGFLRRREARAYAERVIAAFDVRCGGPDAPAGSLSGGNLQKFIIGREILQQPDILVVAQPTWGIDAAAVAIVQQALLDLAARGCAVVVISQDLDELLALSDRLAVMHAGRLSPPRSTASLTLDEIGLLMGGAHGAAAGHMAGAA
jgi:simple sugar transport system ATP-binding protein